VPQLLGKLTVILGGIGVVETTMAGLYTLPGVPKAATSMVVLGYRLLSFWLPTLSGIALVPTSNAAARVDSGYLILSPGVRVGTCLPASRGLTPTPDPPLSHSRF